MKPSQPTSLKSQYNKVVGEDKHTLTLSHLLPCHIVGEEQRVNDMLQWMTSPIYCGEGVEAVHNS